MYCVKCGTAIDGNFCPNCGTPVNGNAQNFTQKSESDEIFDDVMKRIKNLKSLRLKDLFVDVFKKHSKEETDELFISGTSKTTPPESEISAFWPKPWLFSRILILMAATYAILYVCLTQFGNTNMVPGVMFIGSMAVPFSLLIFFFEANAPRNISIFNVLKMFFIGGCASLFATLMLFGFVTLSSDGISYIDAILIGIVEEVGKLVIVAIFIHLMNTKYVLNGILIGAAIGAGFAVFESAGYAFNVYLSYQSFDAMLDNIYLRGFLAAGGHIIWAAMSGGALCMLKQGKKFEISLMFRHDFLKIFAVPVVLHAIWDMPIQTVYILDKYYFIQILLTVIGWVFIFALIDKGLKQITKLEQSFGTQAETVI